MVTDALVRTRLQALLRKLDRGVQLAECRPTDPDAYVVRLTIDGASGRPLLVPARVLHRALQRPFNPMARRLLTGVLVMNVQTVRAVPDAGKRKTA
jgi:hypothetical protein